MSGSCLHIKEKRIQMRFAKGEGVAVTKRHGDGGDLEINEDIDFQQRVWRFQTAGRVVMALVLLAALLGLLGPGLLSNGASADSLQAGLGVKEYERFLRYMKPTTLRISLEPGAVTQREARVWLDRQYVEGVQIQHVTPQPESVEAGPEGLTYVFDVTDPDQPTAFTFDLQPQKMGLLRGRVGLEGEEPVSFTQFVYP
jgi:hypothetical protein